MRSMQHIAHCTSVMSAGARQLQTEDALSEVGKALWQRSDACMPQRLARAPADLHVCKAAVAQKPRPIFRLPMLEPFNVRRHRISHAKITKKVMARGIDNNELPARLHHAGNIAENASVSIICRL